MLYYNITQMPASTRHIHTHPPAPAARQPGPSLMLLSARQRLSGAAILVGALWAAVFWALA